MRHFGPPRQRISSGKVFLLADYWDAVPKQYDFHSSNRHQLDLVLRCVSQKREANILLFGSK